MEKLGEIMKSCLNCNDLTRESVDCIECVNEGIHYINWKPIKILKPLHMVELDNETQQIPEPTNEQIQNYNTTILKQLAKPHGRTHYYKFTLDFCEDYSIRFFLEFSDRKDYEQNWYLKSHKLKEHTLLTKEMAEDLIRKSCTTFVEEIIGRRVGKKYEKIVVSKDKLVKFTE